MRTYASSFILSLTFATALVLPWAVSRRLRPVALSGSMSICLCSMVLRPVERLVFSPKER